MDGRHMRGEGASPEPRRSTRRPASAGQQQQCCCFRGSPSPVSLMNAHWSAGVQMWYTNVLIDKLSHALSCRLSCCCLSTCSGREQVKRRTGLTRGRRGQKEEMCSARSFSPLSARRTASERTGRSADGSRGTERLDTKLQLPQILVNKYADNGKSNRESGAVREARMPFKGEGMGKEAAR